MALAYKTGVFAANTSTGNQSVTGLGFQPVAIRFAAVPQTGNTDGNPGNYGMGFTDGTNHRTIAAGVDDNVATSNCGCDASSNVLKLLTDGTPTTNAVADTITFDADGFTIHWSTAPSSAWQIYFQAWGGSDLTNVKVGTWAPSSGTGNKSLTGLGFQPDCVMLITSLAAAGATALAGSLALSAFTGVGQEYALSVDSQDNRTATTVCRYWHKAVSLLLQSSGTDRFDASCVSLDSDGFTLNFATHSATTFAIYYLAFKGGHWLVGSANTPTSTGTQQISGLGFQPTGVVYFGQFAAAATTTQAGDVLFGKGSSDGVGSSHALAVTWKNGFNERSWGGEAAVGIHTLSNAGAIVHTADLSAWDSDSFTLNHTATSGTAHEFGYIAFGSIGGTPAVTTPKLFKPLPFTPPPNISKRGT